MICDFIGIDRLRLGIDGPGVTTLLAFHGCSLRCRYCLNPRALRDDVALRRLTPGDLYDEVKRDDLYFVATGGGVTFGGGEPALHPDYIAYFRLYCRDRWKINIETSLNVDLQAVMRLADVVDQWIVDIKDMNPEIYRRYTGRDNTAVIENLLYLVESGAKITARVPLIPGYNTPADVEASVVRLAEIGITDIDRFTYTTNPKNQ